MGTQKSAVHFLSDSDLKSSPKAAAPPRSISPLLLTSAMRYKSDSNPCLLTQSIGPISRVPSNHGIAGRHILTVDMFSKEQLHDIFNLAHTMRADVTNDRPLDHILKVHSNNIQVNCTMKELQYSLWFSDPGKNYGVNILRGEHTDLLHLFCSDGASRWPRRSHECLEIFCEEGRDAGRFVQIDQPFIIFAFFFENA